MRLFGVAFIIAVVRLGSADLSSIGDKVIGFVEEKLVDVADVDLSQIKPRYDLYVEVGDPLHSFEWNATVGREPDEVQRVLRRLSKLVIVVHGFQESANSKWMQSMVEIETKQRAGVILVDWSEGAKLTSSLKGVQDYRTAVSYVPLMGSSLTQFVRHLMAHYDISASKVEFVGFSLGAQIGGYMIEGLAERHIKIARMVSLDAAAPLFLKRGVVPNRHHVAFLEAVHTTTGDDSLTNDFIGRVGIANTYGHVDFYPNGGKRQPGCDKELLSECHHVRAHELYVEALRNRKCRFVGIPCASYEDMENNDCGTDLDSADASDSSFYLGMPPRSCNRENASCIFYVNTSASPPYCEPSTDSHETNSL